MTSKITHFTWTLQGQIINWNYWRNVPNLTWKLRYRFSLRRRQRASLVYAGKMQRHFTVLPIDMRISLDFLGRPHKKGKFFPFKPGVTQRVGRCITLLFHDPGTRMEWVVSSTPWPHFTPGKDPVPILQEAGWAPGPVWTGGKSRPHRDAIPDRPVRSQSLYRLSYPDHRQINKQCLNNCRHSSDFLLLINVISKPLLFRIIYILIKDKYTGVPKNVYIF